jgi:hypothetical protein
MQTTLNVAKDSSSHFLDYSFAWQMVVGDSRRLRLSIVQLWSGWIGGFPDIKEGNGKGGRLSV